MPDYYNSTSTTNSMTASEVLERQRQYNRQHEQKWSKDLSTELMKRMLDDLLENQLEVNKNQMVMDNAFNEVFGSGTSRVFVDETMSIKNIKNELKLNSTNGDNTMHPSRQILVMRDDINIVRISYETGMSEHSWTEYKTFDTNLEVGDLVAVETNTRHKATIVRVEEVDCQNINFESPEPINWLIPLKEDKLDMKTYNELLEQEKLAISKISKAMKANKKKETLKQMGLSQDDIDRVKNTPLIEAREVEAQEEDDK